MDSADRTAKVVPLPRRGPAARRDRLECLPDALENVETPRPRTSDCRSDHAVFAVAIGWATFGHVDIIATAAGKIVSTGRKTIQPFETGVYAESGAGRPGRENRRRADRARHHNQYGRTQPAAAELIAAQLTQRGFTPALAGADDLRPR